MYQKEPLKPFFRNLNTSNNPFYIIY